ncbi:MAG: carbon storage regulator [Thermoguttaceae bacterium]|jgi:carbon storage regulator
MLVLSRRNGERILIDGGITVTVIKVQGRQVRLGIEAPKAVVVTRGELRRRGLPGATAVGQGAAL